jgi:hypothetical protein
MEQPTPPETGTELLEPTHEVVTVRRRRIRRVVIGRNLRRRTRWLLRCTIFLPLVLVALVFIAMRSPLVGWLTAGKLRAAIGCEARAESSQVMFDGRIVLRGLSLRVPGMDGSEGQFLFVERAEIDADWSGVLSGDVRPTGVRLYSPTFRVSTHQSDSVLNIQGLHPSDPGAVPTNRAIRIDVVSGILELGEHADASYRVLRRIGISGAISPMEHQPGVYSVRFHETRPGETVVDAVPGMALEGRVDLQASVARMDLLNVDLTRWSPDEVPTAVRGVWEQLNIKGRIASTSLEYYPSTGPTAVIALDDVSMDALVPSSMTETGPTSDVLSLRSVHGTIKLSADGLDADVAGVIEDQAMPSRVQLRTRDLTTDAALECKIVSRGFKLEKNSSLLPFCPPVVRDRLANFCGPSAVVDADVVIRRDPPTATGPAPFRVAGWLTFERGQAAFDRVPYPFHDLRGRVEFDDSAIDIQRIEGIGPDGAKLTARGRIAPPTHEAAVEVHVSVRGVPLDETFMDSLPPSRREAVDFLFSRSRLRELIDEGLVRSAAVPGAGEEGRGLGTAPEFELGGRMDLDIDVRTPVGHDAPWTYDVDAIIPRAGVLTRAFPLPIIAQGIRLHLSQAEAKLLAGTFAGLGGGTTEISAGVQLEEAGEPVIRPAVTIEAREIPLDPLLLFAISRAAPGEETPGAGGLALTPAALLRALSLTGSVDCRADISSLHDESIAFDVGVKFDELRAAPAAPGEEPALELVDIAGSIAITNTRLRVPRLTAALRALEPAARTHQELTAGADLGWLGLSLDAELRGIDTSLGPSPEGKEPEQSHPGLAGLRGTLDLEGFELAAPIETVVAALSTEVAERISRLRDERQPSGRVGATIEVSRPSADDRVEAALELSAGENVMFDLGGERLEASLHSGTIAVRAGESTRASFNKVALEVGVGKAPRAALSLDGTLLLDAGEVGAGGDGEGALRISGTGIPVESRLVALVLRRALTPESLQSFSDADATGLLDAEVALGERAFLDEHPERHVRAVVTPRSLAFGFEGTRVEIGAFDGRVAIDPARITLERLVARAADWTVGIDGAWIPGEAESSGGVLDADVTLEADSLSPGVRAILPAGLREQLDALSLHIGGAMSCDDAHIHYVPSGAGSRVTGSLAFSGASLDLGAPLTDAHGTLGLLAERTDAGWAFDLELESDRLRAGGLEMTGMRAAVHVNRNPGEVLLERLDANCYAGRVTATATIRAPGSGGGGGDVPEGVGSASGSRYDAQITMAGVCFAPVLAALESARARSPEEDAETMPTELVTDPSRGRLDGTLAISGTTGTSAGRSGVGSLRIAGGDVVQMPLVLTLVQLSNLQVALNDRLDFLQAIFHVREQGVVFDQIDLLSTSVAISGRGTMSWPAQELDLRFNSRGGRRVPVVSDLLETVRDELATTRIRGTLGSPKVAAEPFTGTRDLIGSMMGEPGAPARAVGLPDAATERRRYRDQKPHEGGAGTGVRPKGT